MFSRGVVYKVFIKLLYNPLLSLNMFYETKKESESTEE